MARPEFNSSVAGSPRAEAISWRNAEIASLLLAKTLLILTLTEC